MHRIALAPAVAGLVGCSEKTPAPQYEEGHPAFWLPFQDESMGNHIGQWAEQLIEKK